MTKQTRLFRKYALKWISRIWIGWWHIDICYLSAKKYNKREHHKHDGSRISVATCHTEWSYLTALIIVNKSALKPLTDTEIEYVVVHELMHIFLNEMREPGIEHEERVATLLARSFISAEHVRAQ